MKKKRLTYTISVAILATMVQTIPVFASPVTLPVTQGQINTTQGQINSTQLQINNLDTKIQQVDNQISIAMDKSQKLNDEIKTQQGKIEETKAKIEKAQQDFNAQKEVYYARLRSLQSDGQQPILTYAELLLSSQSISEFLNCTTAITEILENDSDLLNGLKEKQQALTDAKQQLDYELSDLTSKQNELASQQKQIEENKKQVLKELAESKTALQKQQTQLSQQQTQLSQQQAQQALLAQQAQQAKQAQLALLSLKAQQAQASFADVANLTYSSDKAQTVIATAEKYLGVPYVWGGTSPSGFDCSGLMQYAFHSVGVNLPRVSQDQQNVGTSISPTQVQPGDLVFMGTPAYHVGMYIGGGKWIEAPETGDVVKIANYNPAWFSTASRILN